MDRQAINQSEWENPDNWRGPKWLSIYFGRRDTRVWVPKRIPWMGWTINLAHPGGRRMVRLLIVYLGLLLLLVVIWLLATALP